MKIWFLILIFSAGDNALEQHVTIRMPNAETCEHFLDLSDANFHSKVYFTNDPDSGEAREVLGKECESRYL